MKNSETTPELATESLSTVLKTARLAKNITIDSIVAETRISKHVIEQIESEHPDNLPEPVFLKGFIKAYAEKVGLDPDEIVKLYQSENGIIETAPDSPEQHIASNNFVDRRKNYTIQIIIAVVVFIFLAILLLTSNKTSTENDSLISTHSVETTDNKTEKNKQKIEGYKLEIECVEETVLKISTDGEQVIEYNLLPEEHLELKAKKHFNILINNTCGVTLFMNDKVVDVPGKCGQTVNMHLPQKQ